MRTVGRYHRGAGRLVSKRRINLVSKDFRSTGIQNIEIRLEIRRGGVGRLHPVVTVNPVDHAEGSAGDLTIGDVLSAIDRVVGYHRRRARPQNRVVQLQGPVGTHADGLRVPPHPRHVGASGSGHRVVGPGFSRIAEAIRVAAHACPRTVIKLHLDTARRAGEEVVVPKPGARLPNGTVIVVVGDFLPPGPITAAGPGALDGCLPLVAVRPPSLAGSIIRVIAVRIRVAVFPVVGAGIGGIGGRRHLETGILQQGTQDIVLHSNVFFYRPGVEILHPRRRAADGSRFRVGEGSHHPLDRAAEFDPAADRKHQDGVGRDRAYLHEAARGPVVGGVHEPQFLVGPGLLGAGLGIQVDVRQIVRSHRRTEGYQSSDVVDLVDRKRRHGIVSTVGQHIAGISNVEDVPLTCFRVVHVDVHRVSVTCRKAAAIHPDPAVPDDRIVGRICDAPYVGSDLIAPPVPFPFHPNLVDRIGDDIAGLILYLPVGGRGTLYRTISIVGAPAVPL